MTLRIRLLGLIVSVVAVVACGANDPEPAAERGSLVVVGIDGLEWDVALPLIRAGRMPNLSSLMKRGAFGELATMSPTKSPIIWTSIATGVTEEDHGINGFVVKREGQVVRPYSGLDRRAKAIWNIVSDYGLRVGVVGWWLTYPVEEVFGVMVAQVNTAPGEGDGLRFKGALEQDLPDQVYPPEINDEILAVVPRVEQSMPRLVEEIFGEPRIGPDQVSRRLWEHCLWAFRADEIYRRVSLDLLRRESRFDFMAVYFGGPDVVGHRYWRYFSPGEFANPPSEASVEALRDVIPDYYVHIDRVVGELVAAAPVETTFVVVSDHGMTSVKQDAGFAPDDDIADLRSGGHRNAPSGVFVAAGPRVRSFGIGLEKLDRADLPQVGSVLDLTPTLLAMLDLPLGQDMRGQVMSDVVEPDWLRRHPSRWVASHTTDEWRQSRGAIPDSGLEDADRIEQLRALGYLGD